jgi:hypothetical protein
LELRRGRRVKKKSSRSAADSRCKGYDGNQASNKTKTKRKTKHMNTEDFVSELSKLRPSATFLSIIGYTASSGEVADHSIVFHISYENALRKSMEVLEEYEPKNDLEVQAKNELLQSFNKSLMDMETTAVEDIDDGYQRFFDDGGKVVKGVKLHQTSNTLHIWGMANKKVVRTPGTYKEVKNKPLTIAKNKLRNLCSVSKFRQFKITPDQVSAIKVENLTLTTEGLI